MNQNKIHCKASFTMLELMIVILIITIGGSVIGLNLKGAMQKERFQSSIELFISKVKLAQELMLDYNTDVSIKLFPNPNGEIECQISTLAQIPARFANALNQKSTLKNISHFAFNQEPKTQLELLFFTNHLGTTGSISFFDQKNQLQSHVYLTGTVGKIKINEQKIDYEIPAYPEQMHTP